VRTSLIQRYSPYRHKFNLNFPEFYIQRRHWETTLLEEAE
jgi:hypothetical protein